MAVVTGLRQRIVHDGVHIAAELLDRSVQRVQALPLLPLLLGLLSRLFTVQTVQAGNGLRQLARAEVFLDHAPVHLARLVVVAAAAVSGFPGHVFYAPPVCATSYRLRRFAPVHRVTRPPWG